jgi:transketolase
MVKMVGTVGSGHLGGSLSATAVLVALYFRTLRIDPASPRWADRDRFVLSKGHCTPLYYTVLAMRGCMALDCLKTYDMVDSLLQGQPDMTKAPGVDMTSGSLGQGFSAALGIAIAGRLSKRPFRVYALIGDGEFQKGQIWEAMMYAGAHRLGNFTCIMDQNDLQLASTIAEGLPIAPVAAKWRAFGWHTIEVDGHDMLDVVRGLDQAAPLDAGPAVVISHTVKRKGVSFMEGAVKWHSRAPSGAEVGRALEELGAS